MERIEKENVELRRSLNDAIGAWTTEKQVSGIPVSYVTLTEI